MAIEQLFEALPLHYLQHGISKFGAGNIALAVFVTAALGLLADFAWMLYLRSKMVIILLQHSMTTQLTDNFSPRDHFHYPSLETHSSCQTISHGSTSRNSPRSTTRLSLHIGSDETLLYGSMMLGPQVSCSTKELESIAHDLECWSLLNLDRARITSSTCIPQLKHKENVSVFSES